jgi:hypothetical protein
MRGDIATLKKILTSTKFLTVDQFYLRAASFNIAAFQFLQFCMRGANMANLDLIKSIVTSVSMGLALCACNSSGIQTPTLTEVKGEYKAAYTSDELRLSFNHSELFKHPLPTDLRAVVEQSAQGKTIAKEKRDFVQNMLLVRSDQICTAYQTRLIHAFVTGEAGVKIGQSLLNIVISPAVAAESIFKASTSGVVSSLSSDVLQLEQFKAEERKTILENQKLPPKDYSISRAIYDAEYYHSVCNYATQLVVGETSASSAVKEDPKPVTQPKAAKPVGQTGGSR